MKTREEIITAMATTFRHDYGLVISEFDKIEMPFSCGMTETERNSLWSDMAQIFDNDIAPLLDHHKNIKEGTHIPIPANVDQARGMILVGQHYLANNT